MINQLFQFDVPVMYNIDLKILEKLEILHSKIQEFVNLKYD